MLHCCQAVNALLLSLPYMLLPPSDLTARVAAVCGQLAPEVVTHKQSKSLLVEALIRFGHFTTSKGFKAAVCSTQACQGKQHDKSGQIWPVSVLAADIWCGDPHPAVHMQLVLNQVYTYMYPRYTYM